MKNKLKYLWLGMVFWILFLGFAAYAQGKNYVDLNYSGRYPRKIILENNKLTVEGIPNTPEFRHVMLSLKNSSGTEVMKEVAENVAGGNAVFYLRNLSADRLSVNLYRSPERYATYPSFLWGDDVEIDWNGRSGSFAAYPHYPHNMSVLLNKRTEWRAQEFYTQPSAYIQSDAQEIRDLAASLTDGMMDNYEKTVAIYTWVCNNIYYDYDSYNNLSNIGDFSALGTLRSKRSVCEGYANLLAALLRAAGIPTKKVSGFARGISSKQWPENLDLNKHTNHAWNEAYLNGRWVLMDATWDSDNEWRNGAISESGGIRGYHYFDISPDLFAADHVIKDYREDHVPQP